VTFPTRVRKCIVSVSGGWYPHF